MKLVITESQYESVIDELSMRQKSVYGSGNFHMIYPMESDSSKLVKVGADQIIDKWYNLFLENPKLFPKVYKKGGMDVMSKGKPVHASYVVLERLNTRDFKRIWNAFATLLGRYHDLTGDKNKLGIQGLVVTIEDHMDIVNKMLKIAKPNQVLYDYFKEFVLLLLDIYEIKPSADIHEDQFGIDSEGKIKCLDL